MERVLVAIDDSEHAREALDHALTHFPDAALHVLNVAQVDSFFFDEPGDPVEHARSASTAVLAKAENRANAHGGTVSVHTEWGHAAKMICAFADEHEVDHIVMGSRGKGGIKRVILGSTAEMVIRRAPCPVTVVR